MKQALLIFSILVSISSSAVEALKIVCDARETVQGADCKKATSSSLFEAFYHDGIAQGEIASKLDPRFRFWISGVGSLKNLSAEISGSEKPRLWYATADRKAEMIYDYVLVSYVETDDLDHYCPRRSFIMLCILVGESESMAAVAKRTAELFPPQR